MVRPERLLRGLPPLGLAKRAARPKGRPNRLRRFVELPASWFVARNPPSSFRPSSSVTISTDPGSLDSCPPSEGIRSALETWTCFVASATSRMTENRGQSCYRSVRNSLPNSRPSGLVRWRPVCLYERLPSHRGIRARSALQQTGRNAPIAYSHIYPRAAGRRRLPGEIGSRSCETPSNGGYSKFRNME
jgi:hypothetical protein